MPELPEVETICRTVAPYLVGRRIEEVQVHDKRLRRPVDPEFHEKLTGRRVLAARRRGKYLVFELDGEGAWAVHLGMSGRLIVGRPPQAARHVHVEIRLDDGGSLYFQDPRRFGACFLFHEDQDLGNLGIEPLADDFDEAALWVLRTAHKRLMIKTLLMDQRFVVGVGNIYANEALHIAGVRPTRRCARLRRREATRIVAAVKLVLQRAIALGGSSLLDYRDANGQPGGFQRTLRVYGRGGEACEVCGSEIRARTVGGRGTFWCSGCQS